MKKILAYTKLGFVLAVLFSLGLYPFSMVVAQIAPAPAGTVSESEGPTIAPPLTPGPITPAPDADAGTVGPDRPDRITPPITPAPDASVSEVDEAGNVVPHLPPRIKPAGPATRIGGSAADANQAPVITIVGGNTVTVVVGGTFTEPTVTATDDGVDVTSQIVTLTNQAVDTNTVGSYARTYYVSDAQGLSDTEIRTVNVVAADSNGNGGGNGGGSSGSRRNGSSSNGAGQVLGASDFKFLSDLRYGMRSNDVMELQKRLRAEGFFFYPENTGYFGPFTRGAVMLYQYAHYSEIGYITGFFGPLTRAVINR